MVTQTQITQIEHRANEAAQRRGEETNTLHLFVALVGKGDRVSLLLKERGVRANEIFSVDLADAQDTVNASDVLEKANSIAVNYGGREQEVTSAHLLLAMLLSSDCLACRILRELGVDMEELKSSVTRIASEPTEPRPGESAISKYGRDLTAEARMGQLDPVIGRDEEIKRICRILSRKKKNNPALVGEAGVGKTAIVEGLALKIVNREPDVKLLWGKRIVAIEVSRLTAGTGIRGSFEDRLASILEEARSDGNTILFVDELHTIMNAGKVEGSTGASDALKPALQSGLSMIGATTPLEYRELEKDTAFERRFASVRVDEPGVEEAVRIVTQAIGGYCIKHCVHYPDAAIRAAVELSHQYIKDRRLPDKAFTLLDDAGVIASGQPEKTVTRSMIEELVTQETGVPIETSEEEAERLRRMEEVIARRVIGHEEVIREICDIVRTRRAGLKKPDKPIGVVMLMGAPGVGKTEIAKALAEFLFGDERKIIRIDMGEYREKHNYSRLISSPPGYVGYEDASQLTEPVRRNPYSVVLMDEIEKAHPEIHQNLLSMTGEGRMTDGKGRTVDFTNTFIIFTGNIGSQYFGSKKSKPGFKLGDASEDEGINEKITAEINKTFSLEFMDRIDKTFILHPLSIEEVKSVVDIKLNNIKETLASSERRLSLVWDEWARQLLAEKGHDSYTGCRKLVRTIERLVETPLAKRITEGNIQPGATVSLTAREGEIAININQSQEQ